MLNWPEAKYMATLGGGSFAVAGILSELWRDVLPAWVVLAISLPPLLGMLFARPGELPDRVVRVVHVVASVWYMAVLLGGLAALATVRPLPRGWFVYPLLGSIGAVPCAIVLWRAARGRYQSPGKREAAVATPVAVPPPVTDLAVNEAKWLACTEPASLVANAPLSPRKHRLFAVACCRLVSHLVQGETLRNALALAEQFADNRCSGAELAAHESLTGQEVEEMIRLDPGTNSVVMRGDFVHPETYAGCAVRSCLSSDPKEAARGVPFSVASASAGTSDESEPLFQAVFEAQADLARCVFSNPFRPMVFDPKWRTETVVALTAGIYEEHAFDRLPILADALEEAGCNHADMLAHCRGDGPHARGCWVVDLLLGKE